MIALTTLVSCEKDESNASKEFKLEGTAWEEKGGKILKFTSSTAGSCILDSNGLFTHALTYIYDNDLRTGRINIKGMGDTYYIFTINKEHTQMIADYYWVNGGAQYGSGTYKRQE